SIRANLWTIRTCAEPVSFLQCCCCGCHVDYSDRYMVGSTQCLRRVRSSRSTAGQHVFQPVCAVRNLLHHPAYGSRGATSIPIGSKSEQPLIKVIFTFVAAYHKTNVDNVTTNGVISWQRWPLS